jgi:Tfp pilus assembly protein PilO
MNPNEINKLKAKAPFPIFVLLILLVLPTFVLQPEQDRLSEQVDSYNSLLKKSRKNLGLRTSYEKDNDKLEAINAVAQSVSQQLPESSALPQIIDMLGQLAEKNSIFLQSVNYGYSDKIDDLEVPNFTISMRLDAYYNNMRQFIAELENLQYPLMVTEVVVSAGKTYTVTLKQLVK